MNTAYTKTCIIMARVSDLKQSKDGDSLENQIKECERYADRKNYKILKKTAFAETGRKDIRAFFEVEILDYCKNHKVDIVVFKGIDRFSRAGSYAYMSLKSKLGSYGTNLEDIYGTIQPSTNVLEDLGVQYNWSEYSPTENTEKLEADRAHEEVRRILQRTVRAEINYIREGFWNRSAPIGFANSKIETSSGKKRAILIPHHMESEWIIKMFHLKADGRYSDQEIVDKLNLLGFKTQARARRNKLGRRIGMIGAKPLDVKMMNTILKRVIYAGIICEKWTLYKPVKAQFDGLVSVDIFNKANKNRIEIIKLDNGYQIRKGKSLTGTTRNKDNHNFPFKNYILCPACLNKFKASFSRGKSGKRFPSYFCDRKHKRIAESKNNFESIVFSYLKKIKFSPKLLDLFEQIVREVWIEDQQIVMKDSIKISELETHLRIELANLLEKIKLANSSFVINALEAEYDGIIQKLQGLTDTKGETDGKELNIDDCLVSVRKFMEHPYEIIKNANNSKDMGRLFKLIFKNTPTLDELKNGTPELSPCFKLSEYDDADKVVMVTLRGFVSNFFYRGYMI